MSESTKIKRRIAGEEAGNCSWGCPCQLVRCRRPGANLPPQKGFAAVRFWWGH